MTISFHKTDGTLTINELVISDCYVNTDNDFTLYESDLYNEDKGITLSIDAIMILKRIFKTHSELNVRIVR